MSDPISSRPLPSGLKQTGPLSSPTPPSPATAAVAPSGAEAQRPPAALVDDASGAQGELAAGPAEVELPPPPPPPPSEGRLLRRGQRGPEIAALQRRLIELGVSPSPGEADGVWGERTQAAVLAFQRAHGLEPDGLVGPLTRAALAATQVPPLPLPPPAPPRSEGGPRPTPPEPHLPTPPVPPAPEAGPRPAPPEPPLPTPPVPPRPQPGPRPAPPSPLPTPPVPPAPEAGPRPAPPAPPRPQPGPRPAPPAPPRPQPGPRPAPPEPPLPTPPVPPPPAPPEPPRPQPGPRPAPPAPPQGGGRAQRAEPTPPRSQPVIPVEQSLATSAQILLQGGPGISSGGPVREITRVPLSPQAGYQMDRAARAAAENAPLVTERLAALNEADRQHFLALMNPLPGGARLDATAVLALQRMLLENRLPGPANAEGRNLLAELVRVGTDAPLAPGVSRSELISQTLREVAVPASINQGGYGTCAMSSVQIAVASRDPAEYLRLAAGLASPARQVTMRNGQALTLPPGAGPQPDPSHPPGSQHPQPGRSLPTRMLAPALMQLGAQSLNPRQNYNPTIDRMVDAGQRQTYGMYMSAVQAAVLAVQGPQGTARELHTVQPGSPSADRLVARIQAATQGGELVPVSMVWGALDATGNNHAAHAVVVQRIEGDRVHILNPWGQAERFTLAEFRARLIEGVVPTR